MLFLLKFTLVMFSALEPHSSSMQQGSDASYNPATGDVHPPSIKAEQTEFTGTNSLCLQQEVEVTKEKVDDYEFTSGTYEPVATFIIEPCSIKEEDKLLTSTSLVNVNVRTA